MPEFSAARKNMVDCQIHPSGVVTEAILAAFSATPRERFVPAAASKAAYSDESVSAGQGRFILEPALHARMLEAVQPTLKDRVLDIGGGTGYPAAILSSLVASVTALEEQELLAATAQGLWRELGLNNVQPALGRLIGGAPAFAPFDLIIINGAVYDIPLALTDQMAEGGRLITVIRQRGQQMGQATLLRKTGGGNISAYPLFESGCPYLPGFEPQAVFQF